MCGIVGYLGPRPPKEVILAGLKKLEYRGYDSAGIAVLDQGRFRRLRASGKLSALEKRAEGEIFDGHLGIGHTRWATHGAPVEKNAHPHQVGEVILVHNGIIENYQEIREELLGEGAIIESDTDSELVAHLISRQLKNATDFPSAVQKVRRRLRGAFSILVACERFSNEMIAFKSGPPLVFGKGKEEMLVASDVQAILPYTKEILYLEDDELLHIQGSVWTLFGSGGEKKNRALTHIEWNPAQAEKQGFKHFMLKEIFEQPRAVASALAPLVDPEGHRVHLDGLHFGEQTAETVFLGLRRAHIVACGTSYYAGLIGKYLFEKLGRISVECDVASEFRYRDPLVDKDSLVIVISQSGETADTLAALRLAKASGARTLSICNVPHSSIDRETEAKLYMRSETEIGVASTKAFTSTLAVLNALAIFIGRVRHTLTNGAEVDAVRALLSAPALMEKVLNYDKFFDEVAHLLTGAKGFLFLGRGVSFPIALEGALKLKELAYVHAEGYAAGEMKHGPIALIDEGMIVVVVCPKDHLYEKTLSNLEEVKARGGRILSLGTGEDSRLKNLSEMYLSIPESDWMIHPFLSVVPLQLLAYHVADALGHDVDQPRNLAKSVTVE